jgi:hypothetical protein
MHRALAKSSQQASALPTARSRSSADKLISEIVGKRLVERFERSSKAARLAWQPQQLLTSFSPRQLSPNPQRR